MDHFWDLEQCRSFLGPGQTLLWQWRSAAAFPSLVQDQLPTMPSSVPLAQGCSINIKN